MERGTSHRSFEPLPPGASSQWGHALLAGSAGPHNTGGSGNSSRLEHFLSHTVKLLVQAEGWRQQQGSHIVAPEGGGEAPSRLLTDVWAQLLQAGGKQQVRPRRWICVAACDCTVGSPQQHHAAWLYPRAATKGCSLVPHTPCPSQLENPGPSQPPVLATTPLPAHQPTLKPDL